jgi:hypothetical protein
MSATVTVQLPAAAVRFRTRIIEALEGFEYIDADTCAGRCPCCGDVLSVYFAGFAARAELVCRRRGKPCGERDVVAALTRTKGRPG